MISKLKRTPGIYLVGFMGSGKTIIGRLLAERLGWEFADTDDDIEAGQGISISEIFETRGETEFRRLESEAIGARAQSVKCGNPLVLALGGGAFAQPRNVDLLRDNGVTVWLDCPFEVSLERVRQASHRPLARDPEAFARLYEARREAYSRADFRIAIESDDPRIAVDAIASLPIFE